MKQLYSSYNAYNWLGLPLTYVSCSYTLVKVRVDELMKLPGHT